MFDPENNLGSESRRAFTPTARDLLAICFRQKKLFLCSFFAIFCFAVLYAAVKKVQYQAEMKVLVKRDRVDPVVTSENSSAPKPGGVTPAEVNSEVFLLNSHDLIEKVALACPLPKPEVSFLEHAYSSVRSFFKRMFSDKPAGFPSAPDLPGVLSVSPEKLSNVITVTYLAPDPQHVAKVLNTLADLYLEKHLAVHRPSGAFEFFQQETERYRKGLAMVEAQLSDPSKSEGIVSNELEKELTLKALPEAEGRLREGQEAMAETEERIRILEKQIKSTDPRMTTNVRTSDNREVLQSLKSSLFALELKRTELLEKYDPSYRPVQEVEKQIAQIRETMVNEEKVTHRDETSDQNPVYRLLTESLAKAKSELPAFRARAVSAAETVRLYRGKSRELDRRQMVQHDLERAQKLTEENYQLYLRKQEEVRISNELDRQRIVNVAVIERAEVPTDPYGTSKIIIVLAGGLLASLASFGLAFAVNQLDPTFRTPDELGAFLNVPVVAALPKNDQ
jgi:uncharacterized protein involved in exopolysaccharide biosynthesis